jgi:predicted AAA+ superfamily ATPase
MKPWREIAVPHRDVLEGTFQQSEFAADITAVHTGKATREYQNAPAFYERTYITEGMRLLLTSVAKRLNGNGGDPVIQLQTAFGGGKTHTMLAVYHLATREGSISDLPGISSVLDQAGVMEVPRAKVVVIDGTNLAPGHAWKSGQQTIHTLWGELAWQLGGEEAYDKVKEADENGTSPGKDTIKNLLAEYGPCVILIDELVAYIRQFPDSAQLSGGSFDSNLSFVQALTEAIKLVPNAILLASLPESEVEAGSGKGVAALKALEKSFGRVQALWKPVATEEAFEIVRRRLFEPVADSAARDEVCNAFKATYISEGSKLPSETQESRYADRMLQSYPIHPEVFDRLYEDWATLDGFQRTRGVLKLMAKVIYKLWKDQNKDLMILPGSLPLYDNETRNELLYHLQAGWDPVLERDIDGPRAETTELENKEPRFGAVEAARRVARTLFLGTAPDAVSTRIMTTTTRGLTRPRVLLGCLQPGQSSSLYSDALGRLSDNLHYLNTSGDRGQDTTRFWFDTRANLRREMEERKKRFKDKQHVEPEMAKIVTKLCGSISITKALHVFTPHKDVPDDGELRLVVLPPESFYSKNEERLSINAVREFVKSHGDQPRHRQNRVLFLAPDHDSLARLKDALRTALAWESIIEDVAGHRLNIDRAQEKQAKRELQTTVDSLPKVARECFRWLLCPFMDTPTEREVTVEAFPLNTSGSNLSAEFERVCSENELVIMAWSPIHLRDSVLKNFYWKAERESVKAIDVWNDTLRYLYLPRLHTRSIFEQTIQKGAASQDFFGTAYGEHEGKYDGFVIGDANVQLDDTLLLIEPGAAAEYAATKASEKPSENTTEPSTTIPGESDQVPFDPVKPDGTPDAPPVGPTVEKPVRDFHGSVDVKPTTAKFKLAEISDEIIALLSSDPNANVCVTLEISAEFPGGASDQIRRAVSENANNLNFKSQIWE